MHNRKKLFLGAASVAMLLFNLCFYLFGGVRRPVGVWVSYAFIHVAYCTLMLVGALNFQKRFPLSLVRASLMVTYYIMAFATGLFFILLGTPGVLMPLVCQLLLLGAFVVLMVAGPQMALPGEAPAQRCAFLQEAGQKAVTLRDSADPALLDKTQQLCEALDQSVPHTSSALRAFENQIMSELDALLSRRPAPDETELSIDRILALVDQRNTAV